VLTRRARKKRAKLETAAAQTPILSDRQAMFEDLARSAKESFGITDGQVSALHRAAKQYEENASA
jgi:hypothetical protein